MSFSTVIGIVGTLGAFGFMFFMRKRLNAQFAHMKAGPLATRLGMQVVAGNPEHNLVTMAVQPAVNNLSSGAGFAKQMVVGSVGGELGVFELRLTGQDAELVLYCKQQLEVGYTQNTTTTTHDCRLTVFGRSAAPFLLRLRNPSTGMELQRRTPQIVMPPQLFGDRLLDERFVLETTDPTLGRRLAPLLAPLLEMTLYVHVESTMQGVSFVMTPATVNYAAMYVEKLLPALRAIAQAVEPQTYARAM